MKKNFISFAKNIFGDNFIPLHRPIFEGNERKYLVECIDSNFVSSVGEKVVEFEEKVAKFTGSNYAIATSNGTAALHVAIQLLGVKPGDEVISQALTFVATCNAISYTGAKPIFVDVDKDTMGLSPTALKKFLEKNAEKKPDGTYNKYSGNKISACVPMHTFGFPCRIKEIAIICHDWNIALIEDTAEAHGIKIGNKYCGSYGDLSTFSFYANKHITSGEGGMILTNNKDFYKKIIQMRNLDFKASNRFVHDNFYWNYRISGLQAALAFSQIDNVEKIIKKKQQQARVYNDLFKNNAEIITPEKSFREIKNNYWVYGIILKKDGIRDELMESLYKKNIETRPFFWPLHLQPAYREEVSEDIAPLPVSENLGKNGLYLPMGAHINKKIQTKIVKSIEDTLAEITK